MWITYIGLLLGSRYNESIRASEGVPGDGALRRERRAADELKKRAYISNYVGPIAEALDEILKLPEGETSAIEGHLEAIITETRGRDIKA